MKTTLARIQAARHVFVRRGDGERGQAAFEFLLILPLFILFILLLVDFGIVMYGYVSVANASREGARYAAVNCGDGSCSAAEVVTWTRNHAAGFLPTASPPTTVTVRWAAAARGSNVSVQTTRPHQMLFFPRTIPIVSCTNMRLEQADTGGGALGTFGAGC